MDRRATDNTNRIIGRYALYGVIASGGMASVHLGRLLGLAGFSRTVAIKRLHANFARDPEFVSMLIDEARLAARIRHPNVVSMLDVVALGGELLLVMEYVHGEALSKLIVKALKVKQKAPVHVALTIMTGVLSGLHAAHEAHNERGEPLDLVHRDVSPHNIQVGVDGITKVLDFGIAKAAGRLQTTRNDQLKGRLRYMAPEQLCEGHTIDRRADVYAASAVLWEVLTGKPIFKADNNWRMAHLIKEGVSRKPSQFNRRVRPELDELVMRGLSVSPDKRFETAQDMAVAIERIGPLATTREVGQWVSEMAAEALADRAARVSEVEGRTVSIPPSRPVRVDDVTDSSMGGDSVNSSPVVPSVGPLREPFSDQPSDFALDRQDDKPKATTPASNEEPKVGRVTPNPRRANTKRYALVGVAAVFATFAVAALALALSPRPTPLRAHEALQGISPGVISGIVVRVGAVPSASQPKTKPSEVTAAGSASPKPTPVKVSTRPSKPGHDKCAPPYYFDSDGVKHLKRECL